LKQSQFIEWILRIGVFGSALTVGVIGAYGIWQSLRNYDALFLFTLTFAVLFVLLVYVVRRRLLGMLETR
jgi:Na+/H+-dicarboxylate symporter